MKGDQYDRLADKLYAAVISDVLDAAGRRHQVLDARVTHYCGPGVLVGRAATILAGEQLEVEGEPYALQVEATDALTSVLDRSGRRGRGGFRAVLDRGGLVEMRLTAQG